MTDEVDEITAAYTRSVRHIGGLPEPAMRRAAIDSTLRGLEPRVATWWLDQLVRGAIWGHSPEIDAMIACADWLIQIRRDDEYEIFQTWFGAANDDDRDAVLFLLRDPPPHQSLREGARLPEVRLPITREVTLGERRTIARSQQREVWTRLFADPDPLVLREVLKNSGATVSDVLRATSRRPTKPELLDEIVVSPRWFREQEIRESIARNPFSRTGTALRVLPTLGIPVLRQLQFAGDLHEMVGQFATLLVTLREKRTAPWNV